MHGAPSVSEVASGVGSRKEALRIEGSPFGVRLLSREPLELESFSPRASSDESELKRWQVGEGGPWAVGSVLLNLVSSHPGGTGDQVGALCPEVGSSLLPFGHSGHHL